MRSHPVYQHRQNGNDGYPISFQTFVFADAPRHNLIAS
jgi:hypothetical protein